VHFGALISEKVFPPLQQVFVSSPSMTQALAVLAQNALALALRQPAPVVKIGENHDWILRVFMGFV